MLHEPDRAELQLGWCQGTQPVGHKAPRYLVYISSLSPALQSLYLKSIHTVLPFHISTQYVAVYLDRESQHRLISCMRMKTCMKMVAVWGYASGPGWCVSCQSIRVHIWKTVHIRAFGPRDRDDQSSQSTSHQTIQSNTVCYFRC